MKYTVAEENIGTSLFPKFSISLQKNLVKNDNIGLLESEKTLVMASYQRWPCPHD